MSSMEARSRQARRLSWGDEEEEGEGMDESEELLEGED